MRNAKSNSGFTLIELLIVIAIIGILAAVLIPNLLAARSRANDTAVQSQLQQVATFQEMHQIDENEYGTQTELEAIGLRDAPANITYGTWDADANDYCVDAKHSGGTGDFKVTPENGVESGTC